MKIIFLLCSLFVFNVGASADETSANKPIDYFSWCKSQKNAFWDGRTSKCFCDEKGQDVECNPKSGDIAKSLDKKDEYHSWCKSQKNAFWDGRTNACFCDENGKDVECKPKKSLDNNSSSDNSNQANVVKGCRFISDYQIIKQGDKIQADCQCKKKIPIVCAANIFCDGSDKEFGTDSDYVTCQQVNGACPSLKVCLEDQTINPSEVVIDKIIGNQPTQKVIGK